ncbi:MAG: hypothetical protein ACKO7Y_00085 [Candidatus Nitrosotenuis sp.]
MVSDINADEAEIIRIISNLPEFSHLSTANLGKIRREINSTISKVLQQYYLENTRNSKGEWTERFAEFGITEHDGKTMIACARRLGIEIS